MTENNQCEDRTNCIYYIGLCNKTYSILFYSILPMVPYLQLGAPANQP